MEALSLRIGVVAEHKNSCKGDGVAVCVNNLPQG